MVDGWTSYEIGYAAEFKRGARFSGGVRLETVQMRIREVETAREAKATMEAGDIAEVTTDNEAGQQKEQ